MNYKKNKNGELFKQFQQYLKVDKVQNYIPLYTRFFKLNDTNWNSINLDNTPLTHLEEKEDGFYFNDSPIFIKLSPLLDPLKYLTGSYSEYNNTLPKLHSSPHPKLSDVNNSSYVDSFFSYLSSLLLPQGFLHGTLFYGSFLGIKTDFEYDISEEIEHLQDSEFFHLQRDILFKLSDEYSSSDSRKNKHKLVVCDEPIELTFDSLDDPIEVNSPVESEINLHVAIQQFPVQLIAIEKYTDTLDSLLDEMNTEELTSCLMQIIMILITYQKLFSFIHNDLHTNNIMYVPTELTHVTYCFKGVYYKVPTFGKLYKIIDFGRAIYTLHDKRFVSDSFHPEGDAGTQYNLEPYFNCAEPPLDANPSFDLCRLACSILEGYEEDEDIFKVLEEWTQDDAGESVLFKNNVERYPDFELYRMIARTVHQHSPEVQLTRPIFAQFQCEPCECMNIDTYKIQFN